MHTDPARVRETEIITLTSRRLDLASEARGAIRQGDGRSTEAIRADQEAVNDRLRTLLGR